MTLSFLSWNIWFNEEERSHRTHNIIQTVTDNEIDFIAFQEVVQESLNVIKKQKKNYTLIGTPFFQTYDTIILSKYPCLSWSRFPLPESSMGRNLLLAEFQLPDGKTINVGTFHLESVFGSFPAEKLKKTQLEYIDSLCPPDTVFMGDTNILSNQSPMTLQSPDIFERIGGPEAYRYTYSGRTNRNIKNRSYNSRFDRIYLKTTTPFKVDSFFLLGTENDVFNTTRNQYLPPSDHYGVITSLNLQTK